MKAEHRRIDAFELWCWRRLLRVPWTARRSNQSILKQISPECSLEGLILKLKLQYFGYLMWRTDSFEKPWCRERLKAGGEVDDRGWLDVITNSMDMKERKWKKVKSLHCVRLFVIPWTVAYQDPPSMGFSRQEYWSGLPFPSPGRNPGVPNPGVEPGSPTL